MLNLLRNFVIGHTFNLWYENKKLKPTMCLPDKQDKEFIALLLRSISIFNLKS